MTDAETDFDPRLRVSYRAWTSLPIRFGDQDVLGHVNNAATAAYLEHARCEHLIPLIEAAAVPNLDIVLARIVIDYVREMRYPGTVEVGVRIARLGNKSFVIAAGVFLGEVCCATSEATIVFFDAVTRRSATPTDGLRRALEKLR